MARPWYATGRGLTQDPELEEAKRRSLAYFLSGYGLDEELDDRREESDAFWRERQEQGREKRAAEARQRLPQHGRSYRDLQSSGLAGSRASHAAPLSGPDPRIEMDYGGQPPRPPMPRDIEPTGLRTEPLQEPYEAAPPQTLEDVMRGDSSIADQQVDLDHWKTEESAVHPSGRVLKGDALSDFSGPGFEEELAESLKFRPEELKAAYAKQMKDPRHRSRVITRWEETQRLKGEFPEGEAPRELIDGSNYYEEQMRANPESAAYLESGGTQGLINRERAKSRYNTVRNRSLQEGGGLHGLGDEYRERRDRMMKVDLGSRPGEDPVVATRLRPGSNTAVVGGRMVDVTPRHKPKRLIEGPVTSGDLQRLGLKGRRQGRPSYRIKEDRDFRAAKKFETGQSQQDGSSGKKFIVKTGDEMGLTPEEAKIVNNMRRKAYAKGVQADQRRLRRMTPRQRRAELDRRTAEKFAEEDKENNKENNKGWPEPPDQKKTEQGKDPHAGT